MGKHHCTVCKVAGLRGSMFYKISDPQTLKKASLPSKGGFCLKCFSIQLLVSPFSALASNGWP